MSSEFDAITLLLPSSLWWMPWKRHSVVLLLHLPVSQLVCVQYVWTYNEDLSRLDRNTGHQTLLSLSLTIVTVGLSGGTDIISAELFSETDSLLDTSVTVCSDEAVVTTLV